MADYWLGKNHASNRHQAAVGEPEVELSRLGVAALRLFGSHARGQARDERGVDFLVTFAVQPGFDAFMDVKLFLEDLLGRRVDLVTDAALEPRLKLRIEAEAIRVA